MIDVALTKNLNDPIAQHMRGGFASLLVDQTVGEALETVRRQPPEGRIIYFYVLDQENRLKGRGAHSPFASQSAGKTDRRDHG